MALIQIEEEILKDMLDRVAYLHKLYIKLYESLRNKGIGDWLTMEQVCDILNVSDTKVRSLKKGGRIGFIKCGKTLRFDAEDVFSLLTHIDRKADG